MCPSRLGVVLMAVGAVLTVAGAAMYVLPGPGLPVISLGPLVLAAGAVLRVVSRKHPGQ
ncbi:hypothetical protein V1460_20865 [Streptomyces sp. SCSIO 30461]|uniref:hypothetical protein n=1 Tax=Streptomyces sp. SCSIO 30461 TaxID=3118085 RepID=UPI0030CFABCC